MTLDRSAIMRDAWRRYRDSQRLGLGFDFARCLRLSWTAAKLKAEFPRHRYNPETPSEHIKRISALGIAIHYETLAALAR